MRMKRIILPLLLSLASFTLWAQEPTADEVVARADANLRGTSSYSEMTMQIVRPTYQRSISLKSWSKGTRLSLIRVTAPAKDRGQGYLKIGKELWNWLPSIDRMVKMSSSVMGQSWMGSDFTNDDMVRESSIVHDYTAQIAGSETQRGYDCYRVILTPKPEAAVVWGQVISWIDKKEYLIIRSENYDEDKVLAQTTENYDFKPFGKRIAPTRTEVTPADKPNQKTVVTIQRATYDEPIADSYFSQQNLKAGDR